MIDLLERVQELVKESAKKEKKEGVVGRLRRRKRYYFEGKRIKAQEAKNITKALKEQKPKTDTEKKVEQLVGRKPTTGQLTRWGLLGAGAGVGTHIVGNAIGGGGKWLPKGGLKGAMKPSGAVLAPRNLARAGAVGAAFASGVPVARKLWDIQTARDNPEAF